MCVDLQACTRQFYMGCMLSSIFMLLLCMIITCIKQATQFFTYLQIKVLLRTRLPHMTSPQLEINFVFIQFRCGCAIWC